MPVGAGALGPIHFESFMSQGVLPVRTYTPVLEQFQLQLLPSHPNPRWSLLNPSLFASMDSTEDIHSFAFRCLPDILGHRPAIEHVVASYFGGVNTWFTIIERSSFTAAVEAMWETPSAETAVLLVCMRLILRAPTDNTAAAGMADSLYLSAKTMLSLVQSKVPLSIPLLQAELIVAMYEYSHSMPQQAYMTVGRCFQITKAFGWHYEPFWSEERQSLAPAHLKLCSILWWAVVYIDWYIPPSRNPSNQYSSTDMSPQPRTRQLPGPKIPDAHGQSPLGLYHPLSRISRSTPPRELRLRPRGGGLRRPLPRRRHRLHRRHDLARSHVGVVPQQRPPAAVGHRAPDPDRPQHALGRHHGAHDQRHVGKLEAGRPHRSGGNQFHVHSFASLPLLFHPPSSPAVAEFTTPSTATTHPPPN